MKDLAQPDLWESDQEYEEFLADLYASRRLRPLAHGRRLTSAEPTSSAGDQLGTGCATRVLETRSS